jgi:hypothetical protein
MNYSSIVWLPICAGLTAVGLVLSYYFGRRRGYRSMLRGAAWSLLPLAAYLTGSVEMFWKIGVAIGHYADGFVFSPVKWAGVGVAGIAALLFVTTGGRARRRSARLARKDARAERTRGTAGAGGAASAVPGKTAAPTQALDTLTLDTRDLTAPSGTAAAQAKAERGKAERGKAAKPARGAKTSPASGDDMTDIEDILRNRGI